MDSYREFPSEFELNAQGEPGPAEDIAAQIGTDERRMHVRAYNYWAGLLDGRDFPSIEDLEPNDVTDFSGNSVLLDFNHPLAGETLHFDVEIANLRAATEEELSHGHVHGDQNAH